jgi:alpha-L-fucosidase 2
MASFEQTRPVIPNALRLTFGFAVNVLLMADCTARATEAGANKETTVAANTPTAMSQSITSSYSPREGKWQIDWPGRLSQHDVVYLSPPEDESLGLPIGNGDLGALLWTAESKLVLAINKCDTWDDNKPGAFSNWSREEEEASTTLRHGGRLVIDFGCPVFDLLYQKNFQARIELASAKASLRAETPFAKAAISSYASASDQVLVVRGETSGAEVYPRQIELERWGSRTFGHWYSYVVRDPAHGLGGTETAVEKNRIVIHQQLRTLSFVLAAQVVPDGPPVTPRKLHSRAGVVDLPSTLRAEFTIYVTAVTSENESDPVSAAHRILDRAVARGEAAIRQRHETDWKEFWSKSMVDLPEKYLENYWYLNLYYANSASRGAYPPLFSNGLWNWNRDFSPWIYYFHWNEQWSVWPLHAANHAELVVPYLRFRSAQLPHAIDFAREHLKKPGAFYSDVSDRRGYNSRGEAHNLTPGAQIALDFWRHYCFTPDQKFLRDSAWPVIREVSRFYAASLKPGDDGFYHISGSSAYEGSPLFTDTITDLAMIRALFPVAVRAGRLLGHDPSEVSHWQTVVDGLAPFHPLDLEASEFEQVGNRLLHRGGLAPGKQLTSSKVFAVGQDEKGKWVRNRYAGRKLAYYGIPDPEIAPVVPGGVIGLAQRGTDLFQSAVTQLRLHPGGLSDSSSAAGSTDFNEALCTGWCPYTIALARLGLGEEVASALTNFVSTFQLYPQGFGQWSYNYKREQDYRWGQNVVRDADDKKGKFPFPTWPFRHFSFEPNGIGASAINEMLLQSYDGTIRVAPAVPAAWSVRFDLAAQGGFRVNAEVDQGNISWAAVESQLGGPCRLVHPWPADGPIVCLDVMAGEEPKRVPLAEQSVGLDQVVSWETLIGHRYLLLRNETLLGRWNVMRDTPSPRSEPRRMKGAILGRERLY